MRIARSENFAENSTFVCGSSVQVTATSGPAETDSGLQQPEHGIQCRTHHAVVQRRIGGIARADGDMQGKTAERAAVQQPEHAPEQGAQHSAELTQRGGSTLGRNGAARVGRAADITQTEQREDLLHKLFVRLAVRADGQERIAGVNENPASGVKAR